MKKVLVFGSFDVLHPGHFNFFKQAKALGDYLIVAVALDSTVTEVKDHTTAYDQNQRLEQVRRCTDVDLALHGYYDDKYRVIQEIQPDIIALGYDQNAFVDQLQHELDKRGINSKIVRLKPFHPEKFKSSLLKKNF